MIVLGPRAYELRAYVGSTAWSVLEEMMQRSHGDGDHVVAQVSIRSLASSLGLAKDTVNRAVRRLRDLGVIEAFQARTNATDSGEITVTRLDGRGTITLPADYARQHVQLAYATTEHGAQGETADRSLTLATTATTGRGLYVGMTRGRDENLALVVTDTPDVAEAVSILEAAITIDRADIPATTHRRTLAATVPRSGLQPRVQIPDWFDELRATAEEKSRAAQQALDERDAERAAATDRVAAARRNLPEAKAAHAPFEEKVRAAERVVSEARSDLSSAEYELRTSGRVHRRSARRRVDAATDVLAVAAERLASTEDLAEPTRAPLDAIRRIIEDHHRFNSTRRILDQWSDLDGAADRANGLCQALDQWKDWADGRSVSPTELTDIAAALRDHQESPLVSQIDESLHQWADAHAVELEPPTRPMPSIEMGIDL